jgi:hypothetical protein
MSLEGQEVWLFFVIGVPIRQFNKGIGNQNRKL